MNDRGSKQGERKVPHLSEDQLLAWRGMLEVHARLITVLDAELREAHNLSVGEFDALYQLWIQPGGACRMKDLADKLLVSRGGTTKLVNRLEAKGLVQRTSRPGMQPVDAQLTCEGERVLNEAMDTHFDGVHRMMISRLSGDEIQALRVLSDRILDDLAE